MRERVNNGHFGVYLWARANGCPNCHPDDKTGRSHRSNLLLETIVRFYGFDEVDEEDEKDEKDEEDDFDDE